MDQEDMEINQISHPVNSSQVSNCSIQNDANSNQSTSVGIEGACKPHCDMQPPSYVDGVALRLSVSNSQKADVDTGSSLKKSDPSLLNSQLPQIQDDKIVRTHDSHSDIDYSTEPPTEQNLDNFHNNEPSEPICPSEVVNSSEDHRSDYPNSSVSHLTSTKVSDIERQEPPSLISFSPSDKEQSFSKAHGSPVAKETMVIEDMQNGSVNGSAVKSESASISFTSTSTSALVMSCEMTPIVSQSQTYQSTSSSSEDMDTLEDTTVLNSSPFTLPATVSVQSQLSSPATSNATTFLTSLSSSVVATVSESASPTNNIAKMITATSETSMQDDSKDENSEQEIEEHENIESDSKEAFVSPTPTSSKKEDTSCKILTKYIFINKPAKTKAGKKKLGFLYKQAFRHYQKSRVGPSIGKNVSVTEKKPLKKDRLEEPRKKSSATVKRKNGKNKTQKQNTKTKRKVSKPVSKTTTRKSDRKAKQKTEETTKCRKSKRKRGKKISTPQSEDSEIEQFQEAKVRRNKRKVLNLSAKVDIIKQLESPSASFSKVAKNFNVGKSSLARILKQKDKILADFEEKERKKSKMKEKLEKRKNLHKVLAIKEERPDHDTTENDTGVSLPGTDDLSLDPASSAFFNKSIANRNRKELTLQEKVWMIRELEKPGAKNRHVAKKFGVSCSAVSRIRKGKDTLLSRALSGDVCQQMRRSRECKDPVLDRALLKWYRSVEALKDQPISISNTLLQDKARDLAIAMGTSYYPSVNWIIRWKHRHNIRCKSGRIDTKEALDELDANVDIADIITALEGQELNPNVKTENNLQSGRPDKMTICEHCGIMIRRKRDRRSSNHLKTCPLAAQSHRRDLTLGEKAQVVRALEKPGVKMITLAKKYGVSSSAISRIHKNRVDILARCAGAYVNVRRKRERGSKEPEVERSLCDWYRQQQEYGYHVSGSTIREKAHEIAALMGKDFWPSDSWVFRWRHRNNVNAIGGFDEREDEELPDDEVPEEKVENITELSSNADAQDKDTQAVTEDGDQSKEKKKKTKGKAVKERGDRQEAVKIKLPISVMCEKCGCVSERLKNNRICSVRHAKGCPDLKPRNELTYEERVRMLKALEEPGATLSSVARQFGVSASSMSRMNQKKSSILTYGMDYAGQKRIRDCKEPEVAKMLYMWFTEKQKEGVHVTGAKLKEKAADFAQEMGREFKASTGWLGRWKHRYNIIFRQKDESKLGRDLSKKKIQKRKNNTPFKQEEAMETTEENNQDDVSAPSIITIMPDESQPLQPPRMFLNQRYQTPWTINHQPSSSCARPKEFMPAPNHGVPEESHVPYAYDHMPRPVFHNMFENFPGAANYPVSMVEASVPVRDYLQPDENEAHQPSSTHHSIIPHQPPPLNLHATGLAQHHPAHQHQHPLHQATHSTIAPSSVSHEEENLHLQQQQIMEACRLMNSFAKEKSLGEHVHAALRTIEMTLKSNERKGPPRNSYTNI